MRSSILIIVIGLMAMSASCGVDSGSQKPDAGWDLQDESPPAESADLPDRFVNHAPVDRKFETPWRMTCPVPEGYEDVVEPIGTMRQPHIGTAVLLGLSPQEFQPRHIDPVKFDAYIRFPQKSSRWHRFQIRPGYDNWIQAFAVYWSEDDSTRTYVQTSDSVVTVTRITSDCAPTTRADIERFIRQFGEIDAIFYDLDNRASYRFHFEQPEGVKRSSASVVLYDKEPVEISWDVPLNRSKQPIPERLR